MGGDNPDLEHLADAIVIAANAAGIGLIVTTARTLDLQTLYVSDAAVAILGHTREELLAVPTLALAAPDALEKLQRMAERIAAGEPIPPRIETVVQRADGTRVPVEVTVSEVELDGRPIAVAFLIDVTYRRDAEEALRRSEARFRSVIESAPEAIWIVDDSGLVYANAAAARLFGYASADEVVGLDPRNFTHPDDVAVLEARARAMLRVGQRLPPQEYRAQRKDGATIVVEVSSIAIQHGGNPAVLSFGRDVTDRKQIELQLLQADRLAALGLLAGGMAHAINNPLTYVLLNLDDLSKKLPLIKEDRAWLPDAMARLKETHHGADRIANVVRQMRAFSRSDDRTRGPIDVRQVLDRTVAMVGNEIRHRGKLITEYHDAPPVLGNEARLEQVFLNLLVHATQSIPEGEAQHGVVRIVVKSEGADRVIVEVSDNGPGPAPTQLERMFDPFGAPRTGDTTRARLGLSIVSSIVTALGGAMDVQSRPGSGTTYRVALPVAEARNTEPTPVPVSSREPSAPGPSARILVIDDDTGVGSALGLMLGEEHDVTSVNSVREALPLVLRDPPGFDVVFCDLMMPELSGVDLYEAIRMNRPGVEKRLVFMTGGAYTADAERFLARVPNARVEKPFDLHVVRSLVRQVTRHTRG